MALYSKRTLGSLYALVSGITYGSLGYFGMTIIQQNWSIYNMQTWRFLVATCVTLVLLLVKRKTLNDSWSEMLKIFACGVLLYGPTAMVYFVASESLGTGPAMVIFFTFPAMVMLLNRVLYGKRIAPVYIGAFAMIAVGMCFLVGIGTGTSDCVSVALGLLSALLYAVYVIQSKYAQISPYVSACMVSLGCMTAALIAALVDGSLVVPTTWALWKNIIAMGVVSTALPIVLMLESFRYISAEQSSLLSVFEPITVVVSGIVLLGESVSMVQGVGVVAILGGVLITLTNKSTSQ